MKAILCGDGDLEILLESEREISSLRLKSLSCNIKRVSGDSINTLLILEYNLEGTYKGGISIEPSDAPFVNCDESRISINDSGYNGLCNEFAQDRVIGKSRGHQHVGIYAPGEFTPYL